MERQTNKSFILSKIIIVPMHSSHTFSNCCHWCKFIQLETNIDWIMTLNHSFLACIIYTLWYFWKQTCFNSNKIKYFKANTNLLRAIYLMHLTHTSSMEVAILVWIFLLCLYCEVRHLTAYKRQNKLKHTSLHTHVNLYMVNEHIYVWHGIRYWTE